MLYRKTVILLKLVSFLLIMLASFIILSFSSYFMLHLSQQLQQFYLKLQLVLTSLAFSSILTFQYQNPGYRNNSQDESCTFCKKTVYGFHHHCFLFQQDITLLSIYTLQKALNFISLVLLSTGTLLACFLTQQPISLKFGIAAGGVAYMIILTIACQFMSIYFKKEVLQKFKKD